MMFEAVRVSLRKLEELCDLVDRKDCDASAPAAHQRILMELAVANAHYRQLLRALADARNGPLCLVISREKLNDVERALNRLRERTRAIDVCFPSRFGLEEQSELSGST